MKRTQTMWCLALAVLVAGCGGGSYRSGGGNYNDFETPHTAFGERTPEVICMRNLLAPFEREPRFFAVHTFSDHTGKSLITGEVPQSLWLSAQNALAHLGPAVRASNIGAGVIPAVDETGYTGGYESPTYILQGAITGFDADVHGHQNRRSFDALAGRGNGEFDMGYTRASAWSFSNLTLGVTLSTTRNVTIPGGTATLQARLRREQTDSETAFGIGPVGGGTASRERIVQGGHAAAHHMLQLAVIKVVGEAFGVPYWQCSGELAGYAKTAVATNSRELAMASLCGSECIAPPRTDATGQFLPTVPLRSTPRTLPWSELISDLSRRGFAKTSSDLGWFAANSVHNQYRAGTTTVYDATTNLYWFVEPNGTRMSLDQARDYIRRLNLGASSGRLTWRLPTVQELASLMEPAPIRTAALDGAGACIDPVFHPLIRPIIERQSTVRFLSSDLKDANLVWTLVPTSFFVPCGGIRSWKTVAGGQVIAVASR
jgi:hypothetical protein